MESSSTTRGQSALIVGLFGTLATVLVIIVLAGWNSGWPVIDSDRGAFLALATCGFFMCGSSGADYTDPKRWINPMHLLGMMLGLLATLLVIAELARWEIPAVADAQDAFYALAAIMVVKVLLTTVDKMTLQS
jgi:hypothetical protein